MCGTLSISLSRPRPKRWAFEKRRGYPGPWMTTVTELEFLTYLRKHEGYAVHNELVR